MTEQKRLNDNIQPAHIIGFCTAMNLDYRITPSGWVVMDNLLDSSNRFAVSYSNAPRCSDFKHDKYKGLLFLSYVRSVLSNIRGMPVSYMKTKRWLDLAVSKSKISSIPKPLPVKYEAPADAVIYDVIRNNPSKYARVIQYLISRKMTESRIEMWDMLFQEYFVVWNISSVDWTHKFGWQARLIDAGPGDMKTYNMPGSRMALTGPGLSSHMKIVCESPWDAAMMGEHGVSMWGTSNTNLLRPLTGVVILALDNDAHGKSGVSRAASILGSLTELHLCIPPDPYKDWNEYEISGQNSLDYVLENASRIESL